MTLVHRDIHFIYSKFRDNPNDSTTEFSYTINLNTSHNRISWSVISIPKTFYLVNSPANTFQLDSTVYVVPPGNYGLNTFLTAVNLLITPNSIAYSSLIGKLTLSSTTATNFILPVTSKLGQCFGAENGTTYPLSGGSITFPFVVDYQSVSEIFVTTDLCSSVDSIVGTNVLAGLILSATPDYSNIFAINTTIEETGLIINGQIASRNIGSNIPVTTKWKLVDQNGDLLNLNGADIKIQLITWRKPPEIYYLIEDLYQYQLSRDKMLDARYELEKTSK